MKIVKTHSLLTLLISSMLTLLLSLPAFAQQSATSNQSAAATSANAPTPVLEPLPADHPTNFWDGDDPNLVNLVTHPFASKKYVQRMTRPIKDRLNELDELTAANTAAIKDVDARAQHGIQMVSEKTSMADQHASDAATKAQQAQSAATQATTSVSTAEQMVGNLDQYKSGAQTEIRFRPGQTALSKQAKDALDEMAAPLKDQHSYILEVRGFSSGHGQPAIAASQKMADSVVRYLVLNHQIPVYRIYQLSMGDAAVDSEGTSAKHSSGGRVEISLLKNDLLSSAK
jgi:outer membrane protein OmpA-like peptidoglycan-associated protein